MSPTSNHKKIKDFLISAVILAPCLLIINHHVSSASKSMIKPGIIKCEELKVGDRGYTKGIVTERKQSPYGWKQVATLAESNSCSTLITFSPNSKVAGYFRPGAKLKVAIKVNSDYSSSLLNDDVTPDSTILDLDGTLPPTQTLIKTLGKSLIPSQGKDLTINFDYGKSVYHFPKEVANKLKPYQQMKWYFQKESPGYFVVNDVETVN